MLWDHCPVLSVCRLSVCRSVTWRGGRPCPGHIVLDGDPAPPKGAQPPNFPLWANGWMDEDATWYGSRPRPKRHCVRLKPSSPHGKGHSNPTFRPMSIVAKRSPISATAELLSITSLFSFLWPVFRSCTFHFIIYAFSPNDSDPFLKHGLTIW